MQNFVSTSKGRASEKIKRKDNFTEKAGLRQKEKDSGKEANTRVEIAQLGQFRKIPNS